MNFNNIFANHMYLKSTINNIKRKELLLGSKKKIDSYQFLNRRMFICIVLFVISLFFKNGAIIAPLITLVFYYLSEFLVYDKNIKKRRKKLEDESIFFFEILTLTLETHKNLKIALELTTKNIESEIADEFKIALEETKMGKSFTESLINMKERIPSDVINNTILNLTESSIYGTNILDSLNNQLDYLREKKLLSIKAEINKLPTKVSVISVIFFIPIMLMLILIPVILTFLSK